MLNLFCPDRDGPPSGPTVATVIDAYLVNLRVRVGNADYSDGAYRDCERDLGRFRRARGRQPVTHCRRHDVTEFLAQHPQWRSPHTKRRVVRYLSACFAWAAAEDLIPQNPYRGYRLNAPAEPRRPMAPAEYVRLMRAGSRALRRALFFLRRTGARTCEMRLLTWGQIQWELGVIVQAKHKTSKCTGKPRVIGLDGATLRFLRSLARQAEKPAAAAGRKAREDAAAVVPRRPVPAGAHVFGSCDGSLAAQRAVHAATAGDLAAGAAALPVPPPGMPAGAQVFHNCDGLPWTRHTFSQHLRRTARRLGLGKGVCAYGLRHLWAVNATEAGMADRQMADQLGHSDTRLVGWYAAQTRAKASHLRNVAELASRNRKREP